jgi:hypothetical protein
MLPALAKAITLPSGDQFNPVLPPAVLVSVTGHPPLEGMRTIWPLRVNAKVLPSGDNAVSPMGSTERRSSSVRRGGAAVVMLAQRPTRNMVFRSFLKYMLISAG